MLARAQQDAVWDRQQHANRVRSLLREYYPSALKAFPRTADLSSPAARLLLRTAPTPSQAAGLARARLGRILLKSGRTRNIDATVARLLPVLHEHAMHQLPGVEAAFGTQLTTLLGQLDAACDGLDALTLAVEELFGTHPDAGILTSFPGLGPIAGARILAEIGDDRARFAFIGVGAHAAATGLAALPPKTVGEIMALSGAGTPRRERRGGSLGFVDESKRHDRLRAGTESRAPDRTGPASA